MQMSDGERLIVIMLAEVMKEMGLDREIDPDLILTLACGRDDWAISRKYSGIFGDNVPTPAVVSETVNLLWMWGIVEHSLGELRGAEADEAKKWPIREFTGFDGNHDEHYGIAQTLITKLDEFGSFEGRNLNSHSQASLPRYQTMYDKFEKYVKAGEAAPLSIDALREILNT